MPAYNNYFPMGYQPMYPYQQPQTVQMPMQSQQMTNPAPQTSSGIIWVQGEAGAKAYPVVNGGSVLLMDSESECFYIKTTDASGMPMPLRTFTYKEVVGSTEKLPEKTFDPTLYVTKDELEKRLESLKTSSRRIRVDE